MIESEDIILKIQNDFTVNASEVINILNEATAKTEYINHDRIVRCIIYLANKDLEKLKHYIDVAIQDPRDVMFWAEYINRDQQPKRIRDFSHTFDQSEVNVHE